MTDHLTRATAVGQIDNQKAARGPHVAFYLLFPKSPPRFSGSAKPGGAVAGSWAGGLGAGGLGVVLVAMALRLPRDADRPEDDFEGEQDAADGEPAR